MQNSDSLPCLSVPFTIQRICEIIVRGEKSYRSTKKIVFALEKVVLFSRSATDLTQLVTISSMQETLGAQEYNQAVVHQQQVRPRWSECVGLMHIRRRLQISPRTRRASLATRPMRLALHHTQVCDTRTDYRLSLEVIRSIELWTDAAQAHNLTRTALSAALQP